MGGSQSRQKTCGQDMTVNMTGTRRPDYFITTGDLTSDKLRPQAGTVVTLSMQKDFSDGHDKPCGRVYVNVDNRAVIPGRFKITVNDGHSLQFVSEIDSRVKASFTTIGSQGQSYGKLRVDLQ